MSSPPRGPHPAVTVPVLTLSTAAIAVELTTHICAQGFFDPLPNATAIAAYVSLTLCLALNAHLLWQGHAMYSEKAERRVMGAAIVASGAATCIALVYTLMFLPILPVSFMGMLYFGVGLCAWSPLLNLIILLFQWPALLRRWEGRLGDHSGRLKIASAAAAVTVLTVLVGHPIAIGYYYQRALTVEPREPSLSALRRLGGVRTVHDLGYEEKVPVWVSVGQALGWIRERLTRSGWEVIFSADFVTTQRRLSGLIRGSAKWKNLAPTNSSSRRVAHKKPSAFCSTLALPTSVILSRRCVNASSE